jgi:hypothetical protein
MKIKCKLFGHDWDETDHYRQECKRKNCYSVRWLVENPFPKINEPLYEWKIIELKLDKNDKI